MTTTIAPTVLVPRAEDVLRALGTGADGGTAPTLARRLGQQMDGVAAALDVLAAHGLVAWHADWIALSPAGQDHARRLARRYALVELFLVRVLDLAPAEAPGEADLLEHAISERLLTRIDALLGRPERDLQGECIPRQDGWS